LERRGALSLEKERFIPVDAALCIKCPFLAIFMPAKAFADIASLSAYLDAPIAGWKLKEDGQCVRSVCSEALNNREQSRISVHTPKDFVLV